MTKLFEVQNLIKTQYERIDQWLTRHESGVLLPFYTSVDIRDAGFKSAVVDTNLFPAGFNNLCMSGVEKAATYLKDAIQYRVNDCSHILCIIEEHTRNTWYLEKCLQIKGDDGKSRI